MSATENNNGDVSVEITNFPCPVCGEHLQIRGGKMYVCPNCNHVEPVNDDDDLDFSVLK